MEFIDNLSMFNKDFYLQHFICYCLHMCRFNICFYLLNWHNYVVRTHIGIANFYNFYTCGKIIFFGPFLVKKNAFLNMYALYNI